MLRGVFVCLHSSFCSLSDQSHFTSTVYLDTRGDATSKRPTQNPSKSSSCRASRTHSSMHYLRRGADIAQPLRSGLVGSFTTRTLIVSALVMSACSAANSFLPLSPNSSSRSVYQSCQQINPWPPRPHTHHSPNNRHKLRLPRAGYRLLMSHLTDIYIVQAALTHSNITIWFSNLFHSIEKACSYADLPSIPAWASRCW